MTARILVVVCVLAAPGCREDDASQPDVVVIADTAEMAPEVAAAPDVAQPTEGVHRVIVDGVFDDWAAVPEAAVGLKIAEDADHLFVLMELGEEVELDGPAAPTLLLDTGGDDEPEVLWSFGQRSGTFRAPGGARPINHADLGLVAAPTVSSKMFEVALSRHARPDGETLLFGGAQVRLELGALAATYRFGDQPATPLELIDTARPAGTSVRVMTWNALEDGVMHPDRSAAFGAVIKALNPDVIAFQEVWSPAQDVRDRVAYWLPPEPGQTWHATGYSGKVTVSRFPFDLSWPPSFGDLPDRYLVASIQPPVGGPLILFNSHLSCCDNDPARQWEASAFVAYYQDMTTPGGVVDVVPDASVLVVGDMNLVGSSGPLKTLLSAVDSDGEPLADLISRHTDKPVAYTWRYGPGSFWPGRLDYIIYTASVLTPLKHFVVPESGDTSLASDHLPHVADFLIAD